MKNFFQAEDGIRDYKVTGVQTCALPIFEWVLLQRAYKVPQMHQSYSHLLARHKRAHVVVKAFLKVNLLVHRLLVRGYRSAAATCARAGLIPVRASGSKSSSRSNRSRFRPCRNSRPAWNFRSRISSGSSPSRSRNRFCRGTYASRVSRFSCTLGCRSGEGALAAPGPRPPPSPGSVGPGAAGVRNHHLPPRQELDRKSTRLNSSHLVISYAVFCLKKKKKKTTMTNDSRHTFNK